MSASSCWRCWRGTRAEPRACFLRAPLGHAGGRSLVVGEECGGGERGTARWVDCHCVCPPTAVELKVRGDENPHWKRTKVPAGRPWPNPSRVHGCRFSPSPFPLPRHVPKSTTSPVRETTTRELLRAQVQGQGATTSREALAASLPDGRCARRPARFAVGAAQQAVGGLVLRLAISWTGSSL